tara:strand:+ start:5044 stop:6474 length:1431 start_codon:yes stop_codon:yes gene_type:complete
MSFFDGFDRIKAFTEVGEATDKVKRNKTNAFTLEDIRIHTASKKEGPDGINLSGQWQAFELFEDIFNVNVSGTLLVTDSQNFLETGPIIGQEIMRIKLSTPGFDGETVSVTKFFRIYKISERVIDDNGKVQQYKLHFITEDAFVNLKSKCNYSLTNMPIDFMIYDIWSKHFNGSLNYSTQGGDNLKQLGPPTEGNYTFVLPTKTPFGCIKWLTHRARSSYNSADCSYVFYQDFDGYKLDTLMNLIKKPIAMDGFYEYKIKNVTAETARTTKQLSVIPEKVHFESEDDKLLETRGGMYASAIYTYDILTKQYTSNWHNYFEHFKELTKDTSAEKMFPVLSESGLKPEEDIATLIHYHPSSTGNIGIVSLDDVNESGFNFDNDNYKDWVLKRTSLEYQFRSNKIILSHVAGNSNRRIGDTVMLEYPAPRPIREDEEYNDKYISGKYLVTSVRHLVTRQDYVMNLELSRNFYPESLPTG